MKLLLDTHIVIWALTNDPQLSSKARDLIASSDNMVLLSAACLWEIAIKNQKSPALCPYHETQILNLCRDAGYEQLDVSARHILAIRGLCIKEGHKLANSDPFDRILIAQAKSEGASLLSHDANFANYDEPSIMMV